MAKSAYQRELKISELEEEVKSGGHDDHGGGHGADHGHGAGHGADHGHGHDDHGKGGHGDSHGHGGDHGHGHDDHGGHGGAHGHGGGHGDHDHAGPGVGKGHAPNPVRVPADSWEDYVENIIFAAAGVFHNIAHLVVGTLFGATITKTKLWDLNSKETEMKGGKLAQFMFGFAPFLLLGVSYLLYKLAFQSYGADTGIYYYLAFCAGFAAKPSGKDFKHMQSTNDGTAGIIARPINAFTKIFKQVFYGLTGNMAIGIAMFLLALYF